MQFSTQIKEVLKSKDLNPSDLARMTGYTPQYIHDLLGGNRRWNEVTMNKACEALGLEFKLTPKKVRTGA